MSRRILSSVVVSVLLAGLLVAAFLMPVPYVTMSPGPTVDVLAESGGKPTIDVEGAKTYFDTNTSNHYHFFCETSGKLVDIETASIRIEGLPQAPDGMAISRVDVLVRLVADPKR